MTSEHRRHLSSLLAICVLGAGSATGCGDGAGTPTEPRRAAAKAGDRFALVDGARQAVIEVEGTFRERDPLTGQRRYYDARGQFTVTLSPVPTNDVETQTAPWATYTSALWENWAPVVTGTVVVETPDGDRFFHYRSSGLAYYRSYEAPNYGYVRFDVESFQGNTGSGPGFNWLNVELRSSATGSGPLPDEGAATVYAWAANELESDLSLRGTYTLTDTPSHDDGAGAMPATEHVVRRGQLPRYRVVDRGMHLVMDLAGELYVRQADGSPARYPATATLTTHMAPNGSTGGTHYRYESPNGTYWYERTNVWFTTPQQFEGEVTVHYPDGDVSFHVSFDNNISSGADIYTSSYDPGHWRVTAYYDWGFGVAESGTAPVDFSETWGYIRGDNSEPVLAPVGDARVSLYTHDSSLNLRGSYRTSGG